MKYNFLILTLLLLPACCGAQATISSYAFSDVAMDYPASAPNSTVYGLQAIAGQDVITLSPSTNSGQTLAYGGFGETYVPFAYLAQVSLDGFVGNANPAVIYGVGTNIPFTAETWNTNGIAEGILPAAMFYADNTGKVKVLSSLNPAFAQSLSLQGPLWLRQNVALAFPSDPINGYPSASFTLAGGDSNGDNIVDVVDFGALVNAYGGLATDPVSGYVPTADFNQDGSVDVADFGILINNYGSTGDM